MSSVYSWNDQDSNIDLNALDSESDINSNLSLDNSLMVSEIGTSNKNIRNNNNINQDNVMKIHKYPTSLSPLSESNTNTNTNTSASTNANVHVNKTKTNHNNSLTTSNRKEISSIKKIDSTNSSGNKIYPATRQSTYNSTIKSYDGGVISNFPSIKNQQTNTNSSDYTNFYNDDYNKKGDDILGNDFDDLDNDNDDTYSYDYISNVKTKPGDKLKTTWSMPIENERQYKDLQIINEVSKLQNLNFFSESYVKNLEDLKISQLGLLIDMVKLTDNSFDEFYNIWNGFNYNENENNTTINKHSADESTNISNSSLAINSLKTLKSKESENKKNISNSSKSNLNTETENLLNEHDSKDEDNITWFDINNSEGFKLMEKHKQDILNDLTKINSSIDQIDSFTKSMWTGL
jgi:hypothetical protein